MRGRWKSLGETIISRMLWNNTELDEKGIYIYPKSYKLLTKFHTL